MAGCSRDVVSTQLPASARAAAFDSLHWSLFAEATVTQPQLCLISPGGCLSILMEPFGAPPGQPSLNSAELLWKKHRGTQKNPHGVHTSWAGDQGITAPCTVLRASLTLTTRLRDEEASQPGGGRDPTFFQRGP